MGRYKTFSVLVFTLFFFTILVNFSVSQANAATNLTDITGHWAQSQIEKLVGQGIIGGYPDGTFKPNKEVTRAEFIVLINRAFSSTYTDKNAPLSYTDVKEGDWFAVDIAKAQVAGVISGYPDGSMKPNNEISRQEACAIFTRVLGLDTPSNTTLSFTDDADIPAWSRNAIAAMTQAGYLHGYPDGTFKPTRSLSRAEAAVIIAVTSEVKDTVYSEAGTYGPLTGLATINGNVTISVPGVTLQNTKINGNLIIAEGVGEGNVNLKQVTVVGNTIINGGGAHSIEADGCALGDVTSNKAGVHIICVNGTTIVQLTLNDGTTVEVQAGSTVGGVTVSTTGAVILNGDFGNVTIDSAGANVTLESGTINSLTVDANATGATVDIAAGAAVTTLTANTSANISGTGTIGTANINAEGVTIAQTPDTTNISSGITAEVGGETQTGTTPPAGGGGGGGSVDNTPPAIVAVSAPNLNVETAGTTITISKKNDDSIGSVTIEFSEAIKKTSQGDITLRAYSGPNATGDLLTWAPGQEDIAKGVLFSKFASGASNALNTDILADYDSLCTLMNSYFDPETVDSLQVDVYDLSGNKSTITLNITQVL